MLRWLTAPATTLRGPERRRVRFLAWLVLALIVLVCFAMLLVFLVSVFGYLQQTRYTVILPALLISLALAYVLNHRGHYTAAAALIVTGTVMGPWASIILDPTVLRGDFIPLAFTTLSVLLCSLLLSPRTTTLLAAIQFIALLIIPAFSPAAVVINWPSLMAYFFFMAVLCIVASSVRRQDMKQIDQQAMQLAQSAATLREQSVRDSLTGLYNRRYLDETLERELHRDARNHSPLAVLMMDIDGFKAYNDLHGHPAGDALLRDVGQFLRRHVRLSDIACRYGGDEFALVLLGASLEVACANAERLRGEIKRSEIPRQDPEFSGITLSIGIALAPDQGVTSEAVLKAADDALYQAKQAGRDRVMVSQTPPIQRTTEPSDMDLYVKQEARTLSPIRPKRLNEGAIVSLRAPGHLGL
jgi:diguanylate cyclase (GGDEF)-like protein